MHPAPPMARSEGGVAAPRPRLDPPVLQSSQRAYSRFDDFNCRLLVAPFTLRFTARGQTREKSDMAEVAPPNGGPQHHSPSEAFLFPIQQPQSCSFLPFTGTSYVGSGELARHSLAASASSASSAISAISSSAPSTLASIEIASAGDRCSGHADARVIAHR